MGPGQFSFEHASLLVNAFAKFAGHQSEASGSRSATLGKDTLMLFKCMSEVRDLFLLLQMLCAGPATLAEVALKLTRIVLCVGFDGSSGIFAVLLL